MIYRIVGGAFVALIAQTCNAFVVPSTTFLPASSALKMSDSGVEQLTFKIFPDGRVEESVRGVKGNNCHKITESINEALGEVVATTPTEELYEQEILIQQTITESDQSGGDSSWGGSSSW